MGWTLVCHGMLVYDVNNVVDPIGRRLVQFALGYRILSVACACHSGQLLAISGGIVIACALTDAGHLGKDVHTRHVMLSLALSLWLLLSNVFMKSHVAIFVGVGGIYVCTAMLLLGGTTSKDPLLMIKLPLVFTLLALSLIHLGMSLTTIQEGLFALLGPILPKALVHFLERGPVEVELMHFVVEAGKRLAGSRVAA